ncbi:MAG: pyridoxal phosphate-dependent aminotransferase [Thermoplasmata archaeon]|nr:pyridoxal phosphate-dependent aminotransferase [Thermoplasmata archaeon]
MVPSPEERRRDADPFLYAHRHRDDIVWMSQNTNQLPTDPRIEEAIMEAVRTKEYNLYPHARGVEGLTEALLADIGAPDDYRCLVTNGAIEALYILTRAFLSKGEEVICTNPSFMPIHHQIRLCGARPVELPVYGEPYKLSPERAAEAVTPKTKALLLIDPLNPLGTEYTPEEVRGFCDLAEDHDLLLVHDITYKDFAFSHTPAHDIIPERTLDVYSFSKNAGMAGMRLGALMGPPGLMERAVEYNTNVLSANILAQRGGLAALRTKEDWMPRVVSQARRNQEMIREVVEGVEGCFLPVYPSSTNMFVIDISGTGVDPTMLQDEMLYNHHVFIRDGRYVSREFGENFVRVSFTIPEEGIRRFARAFPEAVEKLRK